MVGILTSYQKTGLAVDAYFTLKEQPCQISARSDVKRRRLMLFDQGHPSSKKNNNNMSSDIGSVPDPKKLAKRTYD